MVRPPAAGTHSPIDARNPAERGPARDLGGVHALAAAVAASGSRHATLCRPWRAGSNSSTPGFRGTRPRLGAADPRSTYNGLRPRNTRPPLLGWNGWMGKDFTASCNCSDPLRLGGLAARSP